MAKSYKEKFRDEDGVWRTIGGRRVFIKTGQSLSDAMISSGKFKKNLRENYRKAKEEDEKSKKFNETMDKRQAIIEKLDNDTKDLSSYDKYNLAVSKLENNDYSSPTERQYWAGEIERYKKSQSEQQLSDVDILQKELKEKYSHAFPFHEKTEAEKKYADEVAEYFKGKDIKEEVRKAKEEFNKSQKTPYNSKAYAKQLSKSYMAEEDYEDKITPKYIQDIDAGRYGNMSDEEAIKNWIDGGADIIYNDDAEKQLKEWGMPVRNDDAYGTYKNELAKQLTPIYRSDKKKSSLAKMPLGDLREMAKDYSLDVKGLSRQELIEKLLAVFNK